MATDKQAGDGLPEASESLAAEPEGSTLPAQTSQTDATDAGAEAAAGITEPEPKATPLCGVCEANPAKYKCPRCYLPYCSVACNKAHRENHPPDPEPQPAVQIPDISPTLDPANPFQALGTSEKLKVLFKKYPGLTDQLLQIHAATLPPSEAHSGKAAIPASLMRGVSKKETWNHDVGIKNGKEALRRARRADGERGEAIREYSELVLHVLNQDPARNPSDFVRQQVAEEDAKLIERLMAQEKR